MNMYISIIKIFGMGTLLLKCRFKFAKIHLQLTYHKLNGPNHWLHFTLKNVFLENEKLAFNIL